MRIRDTIKAKLTQGLRPDTLDIVDESHRHAGHAGHRPGGESHFRIEIVSEAFAGKSRIERHRMVNDLLAEELAGPIHAMALVTKTPEEAGRV